ncbi:MAG: flagellar type III secretion system protein FlhB [Pseudomonadota bacterium]
MSQTEEDASEKSHEPTQQKLDEARKKGDVAKSTDLSAAAAYLGLFIALALAGAWAAEKTGTVLSAFFARADTLAPRLLSAGGPGLSLSMMGEALWGLLPIFALPFVAVLLTIIAQQAFVFAPEKLEPKLNRINPIEGAKNKFGLNGIAEFVKATLKMVIISTILFVYLASETDTLIGLVRASPMAVPPEMMRIALALLAQIIVVAGAIAVLDYLWQRYAHARKLRMSFQEVKDEAKRTEGDPMIKQQRRQKAETIAQNRMMLEVPKADVIMVNPTHYSVALTWDRLRGSAPVVVAKGVDEVALTIREIAMEAGVPIHSDPAGTRAIHGMVEIGEEIEPDHYHAAAAAIRFADQMRRKAKERGL